MKCYILHIFRTSAPFKEKSSDPFKGLHKLKLLTNFDINLMSYSEGVMNYWQFNYDAPGPTRCFSPATCRLLLSDIIFSLGVNVAQCVQQSSV